MQNSQITVSELFFQHYAEYYYSTPIHTAAFGHMKYEKRYEIMHDFTMEQFVYKSLCDQCQKCSFCIKGQ